jgi:hypothetical protein
MQSTATATPDTRYMLNETALAKLNAPILAVPESDRAWSIFEQALSNFKPWPQDLWDRAIFPDRVPLDDARLLDWLDSNDVAINRFVAASRRPTFGRIYGTEARKEGLTSPESPLSMILADDVFPSGFPHRISRATE